MSGKQRRSFSAEQKAAIVKRHLVEGVAVSDLCDEHEILPTQLYQWQKQLFENAAAAFERKQVRRGPTAAERRVPLAACQPVRGRSDHRSGHVFYLSFQNSIGTPLICGNASSRHGLSSIYHR